MVTLIIILILLAVINYQFNPKLDFTRERNLLLWYTDSEGDRVYYKIF